MSILCSIYQLSLNYSEKTCFEEFSATIYSNQKIAVIGDNGSGKTSLLRILAGLSNNYDGGISFHHAVKIGYVPQTPADCDGLSGAEHFQKALTEALLCQPELLLLDEPTNHLDKDSRKQLLQFLRSYTGALLISSHDTQLLNTVPDGFWSIKHGKIEQFDGQYKDLLRENEVKYNQLNQQLARLEKEKKAVHHQLMKEQQRAKNAKKAGKKSIQNRKWPTIVSHTKMHRASETAGKAGKQIRDKRDDVISQMSAIDRLEVIEPKFYLPSDQCSHRVRVMIKDGAIGYANNIIANNINIQLSSQERLAITGKNGAGKSTLIKAIMNHKDVIKNGDWLVPHPQDIGYLDQHYHQLPKNKTVLSSLEQIRPDWTHQHIRSHLNDFLFKSNSAVNQLVESLSGGEKARLSLALIAACSPKLLILDEMTNNLDVTTRNHVIQCLEQYKGSMIVISHDEDFLEKISINEFYPLIMDE